MFEFQGVTPPNTVLRPAQQGLTRKEHIENKGFTIRVLMMFLLFTMFNFNLTAQNTVEEKKQAFTSNMKTYVAQHINEKVKQLEKTPYLYEEYDSENTGLLYDLAKDKLKSEYIRMHQKEYLDTYFSEPQAMVTTDTFVCDNGGFEEDFKFYKGYIATYHHGSSSCTPVDGSGNDIVYTPALLPTNRRFEIVTTGFDPLTGIKKVKFGNKALKINDRYGHTNQCSGDYGVDKIVKRFKVTEANRDFTIWYSVALENPSGHNNRQPFLNIKCDLAPENELCFDADIIKCAQYFNDSVCSFDSIDLLDWSCHRFKIPADKVGQIATLEMIVGDCGKGAHFGYAYFDGICEECDSSALGSATLDENINYFSCDGTTATVCGTYTPPTICSNGGNWTPVEVSVPGYTISNVVIDTAAKTFCFDFPLSNFGTEDCLDIYAELLFNNGVFDLPEVLSNNIEICQERYTKNHNYTIEIGGCDDNGSPILSDDYYMVKVDILAPETDSWILERHLVDPYSNESGSYTIMTGTGDAQLELGPFLVQEGDWWLELSFSDCEYNELIINPGFCGDCEQFNKTVISNVHCNKEDDTWGFDIRVNWQNAGSSDYFTIGNTNYSYNMTHSISMGAISEECKNITLVASSSDNPCESKFLICPPKPCSEECNLEAYVVNVICIPGSNNFIVQMDISGIGNKQLCSNPGNYYSYPYYNYYLSSNTNIELKLCDPGESCSTCESDCYKTIFVPDPDCNYEGWGKGENFKSPISFNNKINPHDELIIYPNPIISDEIIISSKLENTDFKIFNTDGKLIEEGHFSGSEFRLKLDDIPGLYFIRYTDSQGKPAFVKMIKL